jgi:hypothetical protein
VAGCCECGDEPSGSYATEVVSYCIGFYCYLLVYHTEKKVKLYCPV